MPRKDIEGILDIFLEFTKKTSEISLDEITNKLKLNKVESERIFRAIISISLICTDEQKIKAFIDNIRPKLSQESVNELLAILYELKVKGIMNGIFRFYKEFEMESIGVPRFHNLHLTADYRMFTDLNREKKIVPLVIFNIIIQRISLRQEEQLIFQTSLEDVKEIINQLKEFSDNMQKDIDLLRDKLLL
ncbi:MAG: hypothetical protein WAM14_05595 [Candidatus Nitrosopolaris sp.]